MDEKRKAENIHRGLSAQRCPKCDKLLHFGECHYPGCHKVHIECANKIISEARVLITDERNRAIDQYRKIDALDLDEWLESLGEK